VFDVALHYELNNSKIIELLIMQEADVIRSLVALAQEVCLREFWALLTYLTEDCCLGAACPPR